MNVDEFKKEIWEHYMEALSDCQLPTGALALLNPAEYYGWSKKLELERCKKRLNKLEEKLRELSKEIKYF